MARKKISTTIYITPEQNELLKLLNQKTKVPVAEYIRQGIDLILEKHKDDLPGQQTLGIDTLKTRIVLIAGATLVTAATVSVTGIIGWIGLVLATVMLLRVVAQIVRRQSGAGADDGRGA